MHITKKILLLCLLLLAGSAWADLHLSLTQGVRGATPIAVQDFDGADQDSKLISSVLRRDLNNSGRFAAEQFGEQATQAQLRSSKMTYAVSGAVNCIADSCTVHVVLDSLYSSQGASLLDLNYTANKSDLTSLTHTIGDAVYKQLTGHRGIFNTRIAYVVVQNTSKLPSYNLVVADYDGANPHILLHSLWPIMSPAWSPDGSSVAYVSFEGNRSAIYLQDLATGSRQKLLAAPGINAAPAFSPDGSQIALVESVSGNPKIYLYSLNIYHLTKVLLKS